MVRGGCDLARDRIDRFSGVGNRTVRARDLRSGSFGTNRAAGANGCNGPEPDCRYANVDRDRKQRDGRGIKRGYAKGHSQSDIEAHAKADATTNTAAHAKTNQEAIKLFAKLFRSLPARRNWRLRLRGRIWQRTELCRRSRIRDRVRRV